MIKCLVFLLWWQVKFKIWHLPYTKGKWVSSSDETGEGFLYHFLDTVPLPFPLSFSEGTSSCHFLLEWLFGVRYFQVLYVICYMLS
jgi:hypothetical protein